MTCVTVPLSGWSTQRGQLVMLVQLKPAVRAWSWRKRRGPVSNSWWGTWRSKWSSGSETSTFTRTAFSRNSSTSQTMDVRDNNNTQRYYQPFNYLVHILKRRHCIMSKAIDCIFFLDVDVSVLASFNRMKRLTIDTKLIARAVKNSSVVEVLWAESCRSSVGFLRCFPWLNKSV